MPCGDGTSPLGYGPLKGRGLGPCGCGMRRGLERGYRRAIGLRYATPVNLTKEEQKKILEAELEEIEAEKREIEAKLKELKEG